MGYIDTLGIILTIFDL